MFNHAAFHPDDLADARRGHPATELRDYAAARRVRFAGRAQFEHVAGLEPRWLDYLFNTICGELAPGRFGTLQHELYEVAIDNHGRPAAGQYYGTRTVTQRRFLDLVGLDSEYHEPTEPFEARAMWVPSTVVKVLVPEAALLPTVTMAVRPFMSWLDPTVGDDAPSFRMRRSNHVSDELRLALGAAIGPAVEWLDAEFMRVDVADGALRLIVNGYRTTPDELDAIVRSAGAAAQRVAELCGPGTARPFDVSLGAPDPASHPPGFQILDHAGRTELAQDASALELVVEDPVALHRHFARLPVPGVACAVLGGHLPDSTALGRLTWHRQGALLARSSVRGAGVFAASSSAPRTPVGGCHVSETDMIVDVVDGVACCWSRTLTEGGLGARSLAARCLRTMRLTGAADV